jgi:uncharacterized protein with putative carbohydrate binding module
VFGDPSNTSRFGDKGKPDSPIPNIRDFFQCRDDFITTALSSFTTAGTGSITTNGIGLAGRPGVNRLSVAAVATPDRAVINNLAVQNGFLVGGGPISFETAINLAALSDGTDRFSLRAGLGDLTTAADAVDGVYFENDLAVNGDSNWRGVTASNSTRTRLNLNVAPVAAAWTRLGIQIDGIASLASFYVDDALVGQISTNIPSGAGRFTGIWIQYVKTLGAGAKTFDCDYYDCTQTISPRR